MSVVGVIISGVIDSNRNDAVLFIKQNLIMIPESITRALAIPGFIFYSYKFADISDFSVYTDFIVTPVIISTDIYINIAGHKVELPIRIDNDEVIYTVLDTSLYIQVADVDDSVIGMITEFLRERLIKRLTPTAPIPGSVGDFNNDFNNDYYS